jgi:hypothetical protein
MEVHLTPDQEAFLRQALAAGRYNRAELSLARDEGRIVTEQWMRELAADVKQRGRSRLAARRPAD